MWAKKHKLSYHVIDMVWHEKREQSTILPFRAILTMLADLIVLRLLTIGRKYIALQRPAVGKVIELSNMKPIGKEYAMTIRVSGPKKLFFDILRKAYITIAFQRKA